MAWKEVSTHATDIKKERGKQHVGVYLGSKAITTKIGQQVVYAFQGQDGTKFQIYGFTNLNIAMESVAAGETCRITYMGTKLIDTKKFGKKDVHQVLVEVDYGDDA